MRKLGTLMSVVSLLLAPAVAAKTAFAHGGQYRGPAGEVPPDSRQPQDPPPPDTGGGTPTPPDTGGGTPTPPDQGGGTPTPPPDGGGTPDNPDSGGGDTPTGPGPSTGGIKSSGKGAAKKGPSYESWLFWWNYNKDEILNLKRSLRTGSARSSGDLGEVAESASENFSEEQNITAKAIESRVVPLLKSYAENSKVNFDIQASGVLGLAKIGRKDATPLLMKMAANTSSNSAEQYHKVVQETAALALGVMQDRSKNVRDFLGGLATDASAPVRTRCFAAFALGLLGDADGAPGANAESLSVLKSLVASNEASRDIAASALIGIGLIGDRAAVPDLLQWLREEKAGSNKLADLQLCYAAGALGKIGQPGLAGPDSHEVVDALRAVLLQKNRMTRYSAVIALGQIAPNGDEKVQKDCVSILFDVVKSEGKANSDTQTVNFALAALGRIAGVAPGADGKGGCPQAVREKALKVLGEAFEGKASNRSFAALGLGLAAMNQNEAAKAKICESIRDALVRSSGDVEARGALVISLGLLRDIQSAKVLQDLLQDKGQDKKLRGTAAVALGLMNDKTAVDVIRRTLMEREDRELRVDAAIAAGLLKDSEAVKALVEILQDPKSSQFVLGSVASALGQIGDQRAVEPLAGILNDEKAPDLTRALACVALGQIGDKDDLSVLSRVSKDVNYRAYFDAIGELLTIL